MLGLARPAQVRGPWGALGREQGPCLCPPRPLALNWPALERDLGSSCSGLQPGFGKGEFYHNKKSICVCVCVCASLRAFHKFLPWDFRRWLCLRASPIGQPICVQEWVGGGDPLSSQASLSNSLSAPSWEWETQGAGAEPERPRRLTHAQRGTRVRTDVDAIAQQSGEWRCRTKEGARETWGPSACLRAAPTRL